MRAVLMGAGMALLAACGQGELATQADATGSSGEEARAAVQVLADELLAHMQDTNPHVRLLSGLRVTEFDDLSLEFAQREAQWHKERLARLEALDSAGLPQDQWLLSRLLRHTFLGGADADRYYWLDPVVTPYAGGLRTQTVHQIVAAQALNTPQDLERYLGLLSRYRKLLDQTAARVHGQAERGIRVPQPAIPGVRAYLEGTRAAVSDALAVADERLQAYSTEERAKFRNASAEIVKTRIVPAYERLLRTFDDAYVKQAPAQVGLGQYPGGKDYYLRRITYETGLDLTPIEIHELGKKRVAELDARMSAIREQVGFKGTRDEFHEYLREDPRFLAKRPEEVEQRYLMYMERIEPLIPEYFSELPRAHYGVKRLALAAEAGMTYGYYQQPTPADPVGYYYYNGSDLDRRSLISAAHLIYHELIPGHHFHVGLQLENEDAHPVRKFLLYSAFSEGWAEYAASLGEEMGMFEDPYDRYGHLVMQAFLATRLVVDTGMNYLDWPLEKARQYMREHTFESDVQIASESLRYSTDLYGQALGYRLGYEKFWELRRRAEQALGDAFDIRRFHAAAVGSGAMPLNVLEEHIDRFIAEQRAAQ